MGLLAGLQTWGAMSWTSNTETAVYPQLMGALQAFMTAVNANPANSTAQLALLKTHAHQVGTARRGFVLEMGTPSGPWVVMWTMPPADTSYSNVVLRAQVKSLWRDDGTNGGYGSFQTGTDAQREPTLIDSYDWTLRVGSNIYTDNKAGVLFVVQDRRQGQEFFLATISDPTVPMPTREMRNWALLLWRQPGSPSWNLTLPLALVCGGVWNSKGQFMGLRLDSRNWSTAYCLSNPAWQNTHWWEINSIGNMSFTDDPHRVPLPPRIWQGTTDGQYLDTNPDGLRECHNVGRIDQPDGSRLYQLTRPYRDLWVELRDEELEPLGGNWQPWASWSQWRPRTQDLTLVKRAIPQGDYEVPRNWGTVTDGVPPAPLLVHRLSRQWLLEMLAAEGGGEGGGGGGGGAGSGRPVSGVLWPRGQG